MEWIIQIFGAGKELEATQMMCRGIAVFFISLILLRISGRRSFAVGGPLDNITVILLGGVLSRAIVGASPFIPIISVSLVIVVLHRMFGMCLAKSKFLSRVVEGEKINLYCDGRFIDKNMVRALVSKEDIMQEIRSSTMADDLGKVKAVYMERNGEITVIRTTQDQ